LSDAIELSTNSEDFSIERTIGMLSLAVGGTALAGGFFPIVILVAKLLASVIFGDRFSEGEPAVFVLLGGMVGFALALGIGLVIAIAAGVVAWLCSIQGGTVWFESLVGGWTGLASAATETIARHRTESRGQSWPAAIVWHHHGHRRARRLREYDRGRVASLFDSLARCGDSGDDDRSVVFRRRMAFADIKKMSRRFT
jgi:hypothetical protein